MIELLVPVGFIMLGGAGIYFLYRIVAGAPFEDPLPFRERRRPRGHPNDGKPVEKPE